MKYLDFQGYEDHFKVSRMALGTGSAMKQFEKKDFFDMFDVFFNAGGNTFDTAPGYNQGRSAKYLGEWMQERGNRKDVVISTKICHRFEGEPSRLSAADMESDLNECLEGMKTDSIDFLWLHSDDPARSAEEIVDNVNTIIKKGNVRAFGCSNWTAARIAEANAYAKKSGQKGFLASQIQWSLAKIEGEAYRKDYNALVMDDAAYDWYYKNGMTVFAFSSMAQGFFAIATEKGLESLPEKTRAYFENEGNLLRLGHVKAYMREHHCTSSVPVLGYLLNNKVKAVALTSAADVDILSDNLKAADAEMTADEADRLYLV